MLLLASPSASAGEVTVRVEGLEGELLENVEAYLGVAPSAEGPAVAAFRRRARARAREALEALGFYDPTIRIETERDEEDVTITVRVDPGEPVLITRLSLEVTGEAADDPAFEELRERLPLREGDVLHHGRYESARRVIQNLALDRGYFDGRFTQRRVLVDRDARSAEIELAYDSGDRYALGAVEFSESPLAGWFLRRMVPFEPGEPYTADRVAELNRALIDTGYFRDVQVRPEPERAEERRVPVRADLVARRPHQVGVGVGFSTDVGARIRGRWERPWVNRRGHSLEVDSELAERRQRATTTYKIPLRRPLTTHLELGAGWQREDIEDTVSERLTASVAHVHRYPTHWRQSLGVRFERERFTIGDVTRTTDLVLPNASWSRTRTTGGRDPRRGHRLMFAVEATDEFLGSDIEVVRGRVGARWLRHFLPRHRVLVRGDLGALETNDFDALPPSLRFYAGGDRSIRGFAYQSLGPQDEDGNVIGGSYLAVGSIEYGYRFAENWRAVAFTDAGNAYEDPDDLVDEARVGVGTGLHWLSPVGPIRLDIGFQASEPGNRFRLHFSMGPEL